MGRTSMISVITSVVSGHPQFIFALALVAVASAGCSKTEPTKDELLSQAKDAFAANQYDKAEKAYRDVLRLTPDDPVALRQLGFIYHDQGQLLQAYPLLKKAAELQPEDLELQLKLGTTLLSGGEQAQARDTALQVLEKQPGQEEALLLLADASRTPEEIEDARKLIQSSREKDQDRPGYHLALGLLDLRQNDQAAAESEFKAALNLDPKSSNANLALSSLYWSRNDLKSAGQAFKTAADLAPERSPIRLRYADFLLKTGATAEAQAFLNEINRKLPDYLPPRVSLMKMACAKQQDEDCTARVQNVLAQDPINYDAVFWDGTLALAKRNTATAIRDFGYLRNTYTGDAQSRYQLALAYLLSAQNASPVNSRNATEEAERSLSEAIKINSRFEQAILLLAERKLRKGNPAAAVDLLLPLTKERPQMAQAQYLLATAYLAQQKRNEALAVYRQMTELFPKDPQPSFFAGSILLGQGQQQEGRKAFEKAAEISPDYLPATERLVDLDLAAKQYAAAIERVQKFIEKDPKLAQPWALRGKIYLAQRDFTHAEPDLLKAIELDPKIETGYLLLAQLSVASIRKQRANANLSAFVDKNKTPQTVPAMMQLAMIQEQLKNFAAARDTYENILAVAPNFPLALNNLAALYSERLGQFDKAYDLATKAREAVPNEPHIADTLGWILFRRGEYGNALRLL